MASLARGPSEAEVAFWLKSGLLRGELGARQPREIVVDRDGSYVRSPFGRQLEPMGSLDINGWQPDVVCMLGDDTAEWIIAFEVKAEREHEKGLVQASRYGEGAHEAYLCVRALEGAAPLWLSDGARRNGVGLCVPGRSGSTSRSCRRVRAPIPARSRRPAATSRARAASARSRSTSP